MVYSLVDKPSSSWSLVSAPANPSTSETLSRRIWILPPPYYGPTPAGRKLLGVGMFPNIASDVGSGLWTLGSKPTTSWSTVSKPT